MPDVEDASTVGITQKAASLRRADPAFARWAAGYGVIRHSPLTQLRVRAMADRLAALGMRGDGVPIFEELSAADRVASAGLWLVVHQTYAHNVFLDGRDLSQQDFKCTPEGHTGGSLNMVPAYTGYMAINAATGNTRAWLMGQGHCVSAIDSVNLILGNMTPAHAGRYGLSDAGLTRYVRDFYSYALSADGRQESPLGSHVNPHTAGSLAEGGYLGFAELQYVHMPLPGERLVVFLSDGAFEEQRGSDWAPRWWRAEDSGLVTPIMINNGRRIDQRTTMSQEGGTRWFVEHLRLNGFDPIVFDGRDPAAFAWAIFEMEERLQAAAEAVRTGEARYPVPLPYGIAVAPKGAGFCGEGTNLAHNLPLGRNPHDDPGCAARFNEHARRLWVPLADLSEAADILQHHELARRPREREHGLAFRDVRLRTVPEPDCRPTPFDVGDRNHWSRSSPMDAVDRYFLAAVKSNPHLRPRVGNPDEMRSNRMILTLEALKFRVTDPEPGIPEAIDGAVVTALNEEAVASAALGNKGGLNIIVTYEAFAPKMHGVVRQEITFAANCLEAGRPARWLSVPLVLTSHTWENAKNEQSHQDPSMAEILLGEPSHVSRVLFPADYNTTTVALRAAYQSQGQIWTLVVPKSNAIPDLFPRADAERLLAEGAVQLTWSSYEPANARVVIAAAGAYQLGQALQASARLSERRLPHVVIYVMEPGRLRSPRSPFELDHAAPARLREALVPSRAEAIVYLTHTRPEPMLGILAPLHTGLRAEALGYIGRGGTLTTNGLLFVNRCTWAHALEAVARLMSVRAEDLLAPDEVAALRGLGPAAGILFEAPTLRKP